MISRPTTAALVWPSHNEQLKVAYKHDATQLGGTVAIASKGYLDPATSKIPATKPGQSQRLSNEDVPWIHRKIGRPAVDSCRGLESSQGKVCPALQKPCGESTGWAKRDNTIPGLGSPCRSRSTTCSYRPRLASC